MIQTSNVAKRQKTEECTSCMESVLFNNDSLFKIASYLPADSLLNLALTCRRFGVAPVSDDVDSSSLVEESACRIVHDVATEEEKNALPRYDGDNWLSKYNYLQSLRIPLAFDQLVGSISYVDGNKSCVTNPDTSYSWATAFSNNNGSFGWSTAFSNNIMMAGKHYVSFEVYHGADLFFGVMRPGEAMQSVLKYTHSPLWPEFYDHFTKREGSVRYYNDESIYSVDCCMYRSFNGSCYSSDWGEGNSVVIEEWDGMEELSGSYTIGMLLDLDDGAVSVYKNDRKLGVMKRGLAGHNRGLSGHYCWVVAMGQASRVTIKREVVPPS